MIRMVLVDDHRLVCQAMEGILRETPDIQVEAKVHSGEAAIEAVRELCPDVVTVDLHMPGMGGIEAIRRIRHLNIGTTVVAVSVYDSGPYPSHALRAGAQGYVHKGCDKDELIEAIRTVHLGRSYVCNDVAQTMALDRVGGAPENPFEELTQRELEILMRVLDGQRGRAIADELCLSPKTVSTHRTRLFERLGVRNDAELTRIAIDYGLIGPERRT